MLGLHASAGAGLQQQATHPALIPAYLVQVTHKPEE